MAAPGYSLVVVSWECAGYLRGLVDSMNRHLDGSQELVVVDNASSDDPGAAVAAWKGPSQFVTLDHNCGFATGSNVGVERARGPAVVLINPDTELIDSSLDRVAAEALRRRALIGPRMLHTDLTIQASASGPEVGAWPWVRAFLPGALSPAMVARRTEPWRLSRSVRVSWLTGSCVAGATDLLLELGPFDSALYMYGEDLDLGLRAAEIGVESWLCPELASVVHHAGGSSTVAYGSAQGWRPLGAVNWRAVLRRTYGRRSEELAWRALRTNLALRATAKRILGRDDPAVLAARRAFAAARDIPVLAPHRLSRDGDPERTATVPRPQP